MDYVILEPLVYCLPPFYLQHFNFHSLYLPSYSDCCIRVFLDTSLLVIFLSVSSVPMIFKSVMLHLAFKPWSKTVRSQVCK